MKPICVLVGDNRAVDANSRVEFKSVTPSVTLDIYE